eukprot:g9705.t1
MSQMKEPLIGGGVNFKKRKDDSYMTSTSGFGQTAIDLDAVAEAKARMNSTTLTDRIVRTRNRPLMTGVENISESVDEYCREPSNFKDFEICGMRPPLRCAIGILTILFALATLVGGNFRLAESFTALHSGDSHYNRWSHYFAITEGVVIDLLLPYFVYKIYRITTTENSPMAYILASMIKSVGDFSLLKFVPTKDNIVWWKKAGRRKLLGKCSCLWWPLGLCLGALGFASFCLKLVEISILVQKVYNYKDDVRTWPEDGMPWYLLSVIFIFNNITGLVNPSEVSKNTVLNCYCSGVKLLSKTEEMTEVQIERKMDSEQLLVQGVIANAILHPDETDSSFCTWLQKFMIVLSLDENDFINIFYMY